MRLLGAFYDLSEGKLTEPVPLGGPETAVAGAAQKADLDPEFAQKFLAFIIQEVIKHHERHQS